MTGGPPPSGRSFTVVVRLTTSVPEISVSGIEACGRANSHLWFGPWNRSDSVRGEYGCRWAVHPPIGLSARTGNRPADVVTGRRSNGKGPPTCSEGERAAVSG